MKIYLNENHEIKAINFTTDKTLLELEIDRDKYFGNMSDFMILNYRYVVHKSGDIEIEPVSDLCKLLEEDYKLKIDESQKKISNLQAENKELKESQNNQDDEILANMLATTEVFEMVLMMSTPTSFNIENKNKNLGGTSMVEVYVTLILKGAKTIDQVPAIIRDQVQAQLDLLTK